MTKKVKVAIVGATGYTGIELVRILLQHPYVEISIVTSERNSKKPLSDIYRTITDYNLPVLENHLDADYSKVDLVFCCLPHATTQEFVSKLPRTVKVIDLSADFRLRDANQYEEWYGHSHIAVDIQKEAVYGLSELYREEIRDSRVIANPGCYPTSAILPLAPLLAAKIIKQEGIIVDSKSGVSGAGRTPKESSLFTEVNEGIYAYGFKDAVQAHRHTPEIEQELSVAAKNSVNIAFTPHLVPMNRGIISTIYADVCDGKTALDAELELKSRYKNDAFIKIVDFEPSTHHVRGTNNVMIRVAATRLKSKLVIISVIDNLVKGASGQAVQNMNIMFGMPENTALTAISIFP